jgi:polysaccharide pyruvyl transferase WcaK-like protein
MGARSKLHPLLALVAGAAGKRLIFRALGVYASTPPHVGRALAFAMDRADFVSVRDAASVGALRGFGLRRRLLVEGDPALRLKPAATSVTLPARPVGIAVRRVRDPRLQTRLEGELVTLIDALVASGRTPVLLPFSEHPSAPLEQDGGYAARLLARSGGQQRCVMVDDALSPGQLLELVSRLDALVAMRFHAILFGWRGSVPLVALPYDDKCAVFVAAHDIRAVPLESASARTLLHALDAGAEAAA